MRYDEIPDLPEIDQVEDFEEDQEVVLMELRNSKRKLIAFEKEDGTINVAFAGLDHIFYSEFIAGLSQPGKLNDNVYTFLKLCIEGTRLIKQRNKKGFEAAVKIEKYLKYKKNSLSCCWCV